MGLLSKLFRKKKKEEAAAAPVRAAAPAPKEEAPAAAPMQQPVAEAAAEPVAEPAPVQEPAAAPVKKRAAILVGNNVTVKANGEVQKAEGFRNSYIYEDDACYSVSGLTAKAEGLVAGTYKQAVSGKAVVKDADGNDVSDRFRVSVMPGTLLITP